MIWGIYMHACVNSYTTHVTISLFHAGIDMSRGQSFGCFGKTQVQRKYNSRWPIPNDPETGSSSYDLS